MASAMFSSGGLFALGALADSCRNAASAGRFVLGRAEAGRADSLDLDNSIARTESFPFGGVFQCVSSRTVFYLRNDTALAADQELRWMPVARFHARNEGIQPFDLVDQVLFHQKIECTIDRRRCSAFVGQLEPVEELVGGQRGTRLQNQAENMPAQWGELRTVPCAYLRRPVHLGGHAAAGFHAHPRTSENHYLLKQYYIIPDGDLPGPGQLSQSKTIANGRHSDNVARI